jgi:hypothetical protein
MATNIIEAIQMNLGYSQIEKVDPNIQDTKHHYDHASIQKLGQAAIPAVLTALYHFTRTDDGCRQLLTRSDKQDWLSVIYGGNEQMAVEKVAQYAIVTENQASSHMENIADEAVKLVKEAAGTPANPEKIKTYMNSQRHNILVYLPAALNMGDVLHDETLDDKTNKMEGPVSSFMHRIESKLSDGDKKKGIF